MMFFQKYCRQLVCLLIVLLLPILSSESFAAEEILYYQVSIEVLKDSSLDIHETIHVRSEQREIKRGIYRDFPTDYTTSSGEKISVGFKVISVKRDGNNEPYFTRRQGNGQRVYIGNKDRILAPGFYTYEIRYRTTHQLGFFSDHDELYYNAIGHGWSFPIKKAEVTVWLPEKLNSDQIKISGFTGQVGSTKKDFSSKIISENTIQFVLQQELKPREGFTIVVGWPKGVVNQPSALESAVDRTTQILPTLIGVVIFFAGFFVQYLLWKKIGKDPAKGVIYPRFEAPVGMSSYEIPFFQNMGYVPRCLSSALIDSAIKGHIIIHETAQFLGMLNKTVLKKGDKGKALLEPLESEIVSTLFAGRKEIECSSENYQVFQKAKRAFMQHLGPKFREHYQTNVNHVLLVLAVGFVCYGLGISLVFNGELGFAVFIMVGVGLFATAIFAKNMKRYTKKGRAVLDEIEGYKLYLDVAEKGHYEKITFPQLTEEKFEYHLPFAVALGCEASWMKAFKKTLEAAGRPPESYVPVYYHGNGSFYESSLFSGSGGGFSRTIASSTSAPGSNSGFSGGSSSGGGGGGGGGGGW